MRKCLGRKKFTPHIRVITQKYLSRFDHLYEAEIVTFLDKNGEETVSVIARVADTNLFVETWPQLRQIFPYSHRLGVQSNQC